MGQYYILQNRTNGESQNIGKMENSIEFYIKKFGWKPTDFIVASGDYGDVQYFNDPYEVPSKWKEMFDRNEWLIIIYAAERLEITPAKFATDFIEGM